MLPTHGIKTTQDLTSSMGQKGKGNEELESPIGIIESNTGQSVAFGNERFLTRFLKPKAPRAKAPWFPGKTGVLIPRAVGNKCKTIPWFLDHTGVLIPRAFGNKDNNNNINNSGAPTLPGKLTM